MNYKAIKFKHYIEKNMPEKFTICEKEDSDEVIFESIAMVNGFKLPSIICVDNSIYTEIEILAFFDVVNAANRTDVMDCLTELNRSYKASKFYLDKDDNIVLHCCIPALHNDFSAELVVNMLDVITANLQECFNYILLKLLSSKNSNVC